MSPRQPAISLSNAAEFELGLQFWQLKVSDDRSAALTMRADSGEMPAITQEIPHTDLPLDQIDVWAGFDGRRWALSLYSPRLAIERFKLSQPSMRR